MAPNENSSRKRLIATVIWAGFLVGTLDIIAALLLSYSRGGSPLTLLQFIATGVFGNEAFTGGWPSALYGLLFHYCIALTWTIVYFAIAARQAIFQRHRIATGVLFGIAVWIVMNTIVLPLSNTPSQRFNWSSLLVGAGVLIIAVGLPLAFLSARYFSSPRRSPEGM